MTDIIVLSLEIYAFAIFISLLVAVMIWVIVSLFAAAQKTSEKSLPVTALPPDSQQVPVAAIAAAVYAVVGPHRIVNIKQTSRGQDWKTEGRSSHHRSHNIPRRR